MLNIPDQDDELVVGAITYRFLPGPLSWKFLGKTPTTRQKLKERVERYPRQEEVATTK